LALRREPSDVVFVSMFEDDAPDKASPSPVLFEDTPDPLGDVGEKFGPAMGAALQASPGDLGAMLGMDMAGASVEGPQGGPGAALGAAPGMQGPPAPQEVVEGPPIDMSGLG